MSSFLPAFERAGEMIEFIARLLRGRRRRHREPPDIEDDAADDAEDQDIDPDYASSSSSSTSISSSSSSTSWDTSTPQAPPQIYPTRPTMPYRTRAVKLLTLPSLRTLSRPQNSPSIPRPPPPSSDIHITSLPPELQVLILRHLSFADIQRLRHTSRFYRSLITKSLLKDIYGPTLDAVLLSHCHICHAHDPSRAAFLYADITDPRYPFCSTCVACAAARDELVAGRRVSMGNFRSAWVCRWCGYPVLSSPAWHQPHFHRRCYSWYGSTLLMYLLLGWVQFCVVVTGAALCFRYFKGERMVLVPCIISFVLAFWPLIVINVRSPVVDKTYTWSALLEAILLGLWIPPTYAIASVAADSTGAVPNSTIATLAFCALNLGFRLLNTLGNIILITNPPLWRRKKPNLSPPTRLLNSVVAFLVFWTYPRAVEQFHHPTDPRGTTHAELGH
ncbi:uncharacterized protein DNG_06310 [Cephalotrichum gorgonifer]|uniref:F-box domain-containing protein n=1 Tax=Cephalotrichum gorgonifer TaxID=2041049 RepID=A0AAE8N2I7_9PEZI|nr:uncharacterized protein DNG_06310 [Cephalotrichum gorgonifer]